MDVFETKKNSHITVLKKESTSFPISMADRLHPLHRIIARSGHCLALAIVSIGFLSGQTTDMLVRKAIALHMQKPDNHKFFCIQECSEYQVEIPGV